MRESIRAVFGAFRALGFVRILLAPDRPSAMFPLSAGIRWTLGFEGRREPASRGGSGDAGAERSCARGGRSRSGTSAHTASPAPASWLTRADAAVRPARKPQSGARYEPPF